MLSFNFVNVYTRMSQAYSCSRYLLLRRVLFSIEMCDTGTLCDIYRQHSLGYGNTGPYTIRYDTIRYSRFTCAQKLMRWPA